ncbi:putative phage abortive infection protein [Thiobacillus sp.]
MSNKKKPTAIWQKFDGLTIFLVFLLMLFVVGGGFSTWYVYGRYQEAFPSGIQPKPVSERVNRQETTSTKTKAPEVLNRVEAEAQVRAEWGQLGDYFGGTLNPFFGFVSVLALLVTLIVQSKELRLSTEELRNSSEALRGQNKAIEHQRFEQTFFAWLNNYHDLLQSVSSINQTSHVEITGRQALFKWWGPRNSSGTVFNLVRKKIDAAETEGAYGRWYQTLPEDEELRLKAAIEYVHDEITPEILDVWTDIYFFHEYQLDSLFRNLYRLILWIDSQHENQLNQSQKWLYVSIVRGQLSWIEQVYLFYNGLTERGEKFRRLANKYALFDNLTSQNDLVLDHVMRNSPPATAYESCAFDSVIARRALGLPDTAEETLALAAVGFGRTTA